MATSLSHARVKRFLRGLETTPFVAILFTDDGLDIFTRDVTDDQVRMIPSDLIDQLSERTDSAS